MTPAAADTSSDHQSSQYLSLPSSPTSLRRPANPTMSGAGGGRPSTAEPPDERSPLLGGNRTSRIRIQSAQGSPRVPALSRNQSYAGMPSLLSDPSILPSPSPG